ncbi:secretory lipase [Tamaricihabitans halophyticus]|uniref:Secretory lipase n=1 Tax=Tamaricihabitans halophyticus TaxID=1262583 RepID=A0A4R2QYW9_9PSEU|nr:alpha/beta fold hydrolase [Tamaricihabitans halophyticus]TCP54268.1 secretory lipase [Tamaricihabitans halophyticus]
MALRAPAALLTLIAFLLTVTPAASADARTEHPSWAGRLLSAKPVQPAGGLPEGTRVHRIKYLSSTPEGAPTVVTGLTLVPPGPAPEGGRPVISWAHGTTGIGDSCAPSVDPAMAGYGPQFQQFLAAGYAITATDYPGLGTPGVHPYLIPESEARSVIDAVPAARAVDPAFGTRWFAVGHSQGGQAALAAAEIAGEYDPGLSLRGTVGYAPAPNANVANELSPVLDPVSQAFYTMMLVGLKTQYPQLRYADYLGPQARKLLPAAHSLCFDELAERFTLAEIPPEEFETRDVAADQRLREWFAANEIGHKRAEGPLLVLQGDADPVVLPEFTESFVADSRAHGSDLRYQVYPGADHGEVLDAAASDALAWLAQRR